MANGFVPKTSIPDFEHVQVEAQGSLLALRRITPSKSKPRAGGHRGIITTFSRGSRRRLVKQLARIGAEQAVFITLTYPDKFPDAIEAKTHLRALLERFRRRYPDASGIWRLEYQERGAPHFHLLLYKLPFLPFAELRSMWREIIAPYCPGSVNPRVRIELVRSRRGAMYYASKYLAKAENGPGPSFFIPVTYLHAGRFWGVFNRAKLPLAERVFVDLVLKGGRNFHDAKAIMRRVYHRLNKTRARGGFCFHDNAIGFIPGILWTLQAD